MRPIPDRLTPLDCWPVHMTRQDKTACRQGTVIAMIDLSAAFDNIDHGILLTRLQQRYGIDGVALRWMRSYLSERTQSVVINRVSSNETTLISGVPQGSVLGPILFSLYVQPIGDIIRKHDLKYHHYADDIHVILPFAVGCAFSLNRCTPH